MATVPRLIEISIDAVPIGTPLQFALRSNSGHLLASKGYTITSRSELEKIRTRGLGLAIDMNESDAALRSYLQRVNSMILDDASLANIAMARIESFSSGTIEPMTVAGGFPDFWAYQTRLHAVLTHPDPATFQQRIGSIQKELSHFITKYPDASLTAVVHLSSRELSQYSAMHSLLVWVIVSMTARFALRWEDVLVDSLGKAALTMNIAMTQLQDKLSLQRGPLTSEQRRIVEDHHEMSRTQLMALGVEDTVWLDAVFYHSDKTPGPLHERSPGQQLGRLIQRADVLGARLAPRAHRPPMPTPAALLASYFDETQQPDEAGAAIVRTLGIYAPGSYVKLANGEVGVVVRRRLGRPGTMGRCPRVLILINKDDFPLTAHVERDTALPEFAIAGPVDVAHIRVSVPLEKLLRASDKVIWTP